MTSVLLGLVFAIFFGLGSRFDGDAVVLEVWA